MSTFNHIATFFSKPRLLRQLLFWFLLIEFSAECILMYVSYKSAESILGQEIINNLTAISTRQSKQITDFLYKKENDVNVVANLSDIGNALIAFEQALTQADSTVYVNVETEYESTMQYFKESFGYDEIYIIGNQANVLFTTNKNFPIPTNFRSDDSLKNTQIAKVFERASVIMQGEISNFSYFSYSKNIVAFIASPIFKNKKMVGVLVVEIDESEITKLANNYIGLGKTGETVISTIMGEDAIFITNTRHAPDAAFNKKIPLNSKTAIAFSVQGKNGEALSIDYRGQETFAKWSYIPALQAGIVVKIDVDEAYASVERLKWIMLIIIFVTLVVVIFAAYSVANSISKPIVILTKFAKKVSRGDLSGQVDLKEKNEIGALAGVFNEMTANLKTKTDELANQNEILEQRVMERTEEIAKQNEEIETQNLFLKEINVELEEKTEELNQQKAEIESQMEYLEVINGTLASKNAEISHQQASLNAVYEQLSKQNRDLMSSINYAKRTQDALLPSSKDFSKLFPNSFVFNRPKDVVSGDFYWVHQLGDVKIVIVADCTGHGVPGALMSMIGISILNNIVIEEKTTSPEKILNQFHYDITEILSQGENENRESIDCVVCSIDTAKNILYFAGAMNPLFYIQNNQLHEIKGDRKSVGGGLGNRDYTLHELDMKVATTIYLSSDGYQDQFGGNDGKKFMVKRLKETLSSIHQLSMPSQKEVLDNTLTAWMGEQEKQIDDILVVGLAF